MADDIEPPRPAPASGDLDADSLFDAAAARLLQQGARVPRATYRFQLNRTFTFAQAQELLGYLHDLGISDLYASPFFRARAESMHGYDIVDHNRLNPEIGTQEELDRLSHAIQRQGMGLLLDFVPNHMGVGTRDNSWWMDVLENGPSSLFSSFFDIDWHPLKSELANKVLLPILGDHYGRVLDNGELQVRYDPEAGAFSVQYWENQLPLNPRTYPRVLERMLPPLVEELGPEDDAVVELQSIITGLTHLPPRTESSRAKVIERRREKQVLKRRLSTLVSESQPTARALERAVQELNGRKGDPRSFDALDELLEDQAYRLSFWRVAAEEINYRRFFDINDLAAIRMENPAVFAEAHRLLFQLMAKGEVTGIRIDHPDGLWDPTGYFTALQRGYFLETCRQLALPSGDDAPDARQRNAAFERIRPRLAELFDRQVAANPKAPLARPFYVVVEKILSRGETLPEDWPVHGTSGYDFTSLVAGIFVHGANEHALTELYERFTGQHFDFETLVYEKKKLVLETALASELNVLAAALNRLSERDRHSRDFTLGTLAGALREVIACFPVYRTYTSERTETPSEHDRIAIRQSVRRATHRNPNVDASVFNFLRAVLLLDIPASVRAEDRRLWRDFVMKFQQLSGPVMAKGLEDTSFYVYNRLVSLNEVGGEPERFGLPVKQFHTANHERQRNWPHALNATSTHDTKRSEDTRARISVLSEVPARWGETVFHAARLAEPFKTDLEGKRAPDRNEEYLLYQSILGTLPAQFESEEAQDAYVERLVAYMRKATKEAKVNTSWVNAAPEYDTAMEQFVRRVLAPRSEVLEALRPLARIVAFHGRWGALSQALLKFTAPGVPDTYQGCELWDDSLVDPDNRRPVDYALRQRLLSELRRREHEGLGLARELVEQAEDGRIKLFVTRTALQARARAPLVYGDSSQYAALTAVGSKADHVVAFARRAAGQEHVVVAPRLTALLTEDRLTDDRLVAPLGEVWRDTMIPLSEGRYENLFTGEEIGTEDHEGRSVLRLSRVLAHFPVALLVRRGEEHAK